MPAHQQSLEDATLVSREFIAPGFWHLGLRSPHIAGRAGAAQYVAVDIPGDFAVRLPLGIWTADGDTLSLLFREWGTRTERLARLPVGTTLSLLGPLGNRFTTPTSAKGATIVAGGLGIVPFWLLAKEYQRAGIALEVIVGARSKDLLVGVDTLRELGITIATCTDDGSDGTQGNVIDLLRARPKPDLIYGCGPPAMLRALCSFANERHVPCQISMEETFGCSLGTCWGCVVPVRRGCDQATGYPRAPADSRAYDLARVCIDGTVFQAADVLWQR